MPAKGQTAPAHMGTCFGCGHVDKWMPRFNAHLITCSLPLNLDLVFNTFAPLAVGDCRLFDRTPPKISVGVLGSRSIWDHIALALFGPLPQGLYLCHWCDNIRCVSLSHLRYDTPRANNLDAWRNGKRVVTQQWKDAMTAGRADSPKVLAHLRANSAMLAERNRGAAHWTHRDPEATERWKQAMAAGRARNSVKDR